MIDINHGIAGGIAGIAVDIVFYPLETIKTRIMASKPNQNLHSLALSRFKGFSCQMIVSFPYSFTFFYVYEQIRSQCRNFKYNNLLASVCAQIVGNIVRNPFEVIKQQMMVGRSSQIFYSWKQIFKHRGVRGFYSGYRATLLRDIIFSACQLPLFEYLRYEIQLKFHTSSILAAAIGGSTAAAVSAFVSCPLDVIKTRLMTQKMSISSKNAVQEIWKQSGFKGFFKGVFYRCGILAFGGIIYFGVLQKSRILLNVN